MDEVSGWAVRSYREPVSVGASIVLADGRALPVVITNISSEGCQLRSSETLKIGAAIQIDVPQAGLRRAKVRWALFDKAGLRFDEPIVGDGKSPLTSSLSHSLT